MKKFCFLILVLSVLGLSGCASKSGQTDWSEFRQANIHSILILPPANNTTDIKASYTVLSSATRPLAESGYYVFPVALVDQTFKENGLTISEEMHQVSLDKIRKIFNPDAVLYITVGKFGSTYIVVDSSVVVSASARLVDAKTGKQLWSGSASASNSEGRQNSSGLIGMLVGALVNHLVDQVSDPSYDVSGVMNSRLLGQLPPGPRSPNYQPLQ